MNRFDEIINTCEYVVNSANHVSINEKEINNLVRNFKMEKPYYYRH